jgi:hypothetical protein
MTQEETEQPLVSLASLTIETLLFVTSTLITILLMFFSQICVILLLVNRRSKL